MYVDRRSLFLGALLVATLPVLLPAVCAQQNAWPNKPVRLIVPLAPGGTADATARILAEKLGPMWGQPVVVDNRPGAGGIIAMDALAHAAPDGYTIGMGNLNTATTNPLVYKKLPYDPVRGLTPIAWLTTSPLFLIVHPSLPVHSLSDFVAYAKAHPGEMGYASIGNGSSMHLATVMLEQSTGIRMTHIPYKGMGAAMQDLVSGQVQVAVDISAMSMVHAGRLRVLAVAGDQCYPGEPGVPSFAESGLRGLELTTFLSLHGPAAMDTAVVQRINTDVDKVLAMPDVRQRIHAMSLDVAGGTPQHLAAFLQGERGKYAEVIRKADIRPE